MKIDLHSIKSIGRTIPLFLLMTLLTGCYSAYNLANVPLKSAAIVQVDPSNQRKLPAFVSSISVKENNGAANVSEEFEHRVLGHLQQANYFSDVTYSIYAKRPEPPYVELSLDASENQDLNEGANSTKAFLTGFTLFILAPVLPNSYDYDTTFTLSAKWPNGINRVYKASCAANAYGTFPYTTLDQKYQAATGDATEKCLNSVINQLTSDTIK